MARPSKLNDQVRVDLAMMLASGASAEVAARAAGVGDRTVRTWLAKARELRGREEEGQRITRAERRYIDLLDEIEQAEATLEVRLVAQVQRAANDDWRAAMVLLERRFPDRWSGPRRRLGRPPGSTSAPDRPSTGDREPPRIRLRAI